MPAIKSSIIHWNYRHILKPVFFMQDPEKVHDRFIKIGKFLGQHACMRKITGAFFDYENPALAQTILGIDFKNPIGLAAGFDKDAYLTKILPAVGFGFEEIGSVTGEPCAGNPKPRLWRLPKSQSLIVYYGLKNDGAEAVSKRLKDSLMDGAIADSKGDSPNGKSAFPVGVSIAKTNDKCTVEISDGIRDYLKAYKLFQGIGDYHTINISCPNAFGGQPFSDPARLELLLKEIYALPKTKPIFLKMPPDISYEQIDDIIQLSEKYDIDGFVCTNLTKDLETPSVKEKIIDELPTTNGGLSGKSVEKLADEMIKYIFKKTGGKSGTVSGKKFVVIGVGGIFSAEDAYRKIRAGASLLQLITGMIFEGPQLIGEINRGLVDLLKKDGYKNISEAVGVDNK